MLSKKAKLSDHREFKLNGATIDCWTYETRYSWGHYAELSSSGFTTDEKYTYYNRTWESYKYQSIVHGILEKAKLTHLNAEADNIGDNVVRQELKSIGNLAILAGIVGTADTQLNTLKIATGGAITTPDDWDSLTEEQKRSRLDKAIKVLN